jgi:hypothetical protein
MKKPRPAIINQNINIVASVMGTISLKTIQAPVTPTATQNRNKVTGSAQFVRPRGYSGISSNSFIALF